jgi:hypothetical protein
VAASDGRKRRYAVDINDVLKKLPDDDEFANFFRGLGFEVDHDFSAREGKKGYEMRLGGALVMQIDMGVPLAHVLEDLPLLAENKPGTSASDYSIHATAETLKTVCRIISDQKGPPPWVV